MRPRVLGEALVAHEVNKLIDKFEYPDEVGGGGVVSGGGGGAPTTVVAANDASDLSKSKADLQCSGFNDEEEIVAALATGGRVLLTEGTFTIANAGSLFVGDGVTLEGLNPTGTLIVCTISPASLEYIVEMNGQARIANLTLIGQVANLGGIDMSGGAGPSYCNNVEVICDDEGIHVSTSETIIDRCTIDSDTLGVVIEADEVTVRDTHVSAPVGIQGAGGGFSDNATIRGVTFENAFTRCIDIDGDYWTITECYDDNSTIFIEDIGATNVGTKIIGNKRLTGDIDMGDGTDWEIIANTIRVGSILIDGATRGLIAGNTLLLPANHGISLNDTTDTLIVGNVIYQPGQATDNTYDAIILDGASARNMITGNKLIPPSAGNAPRYGVNIATTDECNIVVGNDLGDSDDYGTDALNDNGANTQLFYPNDATYGDNFTDCGTGS